MAWANALALQVHLTIGAHVNPHSRHGKPRFPVEDTEVKGREAKKIFKVKPQDLGKKRIKHISLKMTVKGSPTTTITQ